MIKKRKKTADLIINRIKKRKLIDLKSNEPAVKSIEFVIWA